MIAVHAAVRVVAAVCPEAPPGVQTWVRRDPVLGEVGRAGHPGHLVLRLGRDADLGPGHPPPEGRPARLRRADDLPGRRDHLRRRLRDHLLDHRDRLLMFSRRHRTQHAAGAGSGPASKMLALLIARRLRRVAAGRGPGAGRGLRGDTRLTHAAAAQQPTRTTSRRTAPGAGGAGSSGCVRPPIRRDVLAAQPMPHVDQAVSHPGPVSTRDPGPAIALPPATGTGRRRADRVPAHRRRGDGAAGRDRPGRVAVRLAARRPGGHHRAGRCPAARPPAAGRWSRRWRTLFDAAGLSGGGSAQLALVAHPADGADQGQRRPGLRRSRASTSNSTSTLHQTARGATADCQRMVWTPTPTDDRSITGTGPAGAG